MDTTCFVLNSRERKELHSLVENNTLAAVSEAPDAFSYIYFELGALLSPRIRRRLRQMRINGDTHILLKGLPTFAPVGETPATKIAGCQAPKYYQTLVAIISAQMGFLYAFSNKRGHSLIEDLFPVEGDQLKQMGTNSVQLDWHVEDAFHKAKADYVSLFCLRSDPEAKTLLVAARALLPALSVETKQQLQKSDYTFLSDGTFLPDHTYERDSYVLEPSEDPEFMFDPSFTRAKTEAAQEALLSLALQIEQNHQAIALEAGDMLIFDNRRVAHSRTKYQPRYDGSDRWLLRSLVVESVWKLKDSITSHDKLTVA